ncbi:MAG: hypothetical protein ABWZ79_16755 [Pedobacter agri]
MAANFDENRVQEILRIHKDSLNSAQPQENKSFDENRVQEAMNVLRGTSSNTKNTEKEFSWPRFIGERFTKGALNLADTPQNVLEGIKDFFDPRVPVRDRSEEDIKDRQENPYKPLISTAVKSAVNLDSQGEGTTSTQKIAGKAAEFAGSSLIPGGGLPGLAKNVALGTAIGAETGALEELGAPEPVAALASLGTILAGFPALKNALNKAVSSAPNLSNAEKRVANYLQQVLGEEGVATVNESLSNTPKYSSIAGYEPTTAELAESPFISTLHRLRQGIPGTGLQERAASQNEAIHRVSDKLSSDAIKSAELQETIASEVASRKAKLYGETAPLYEQLRKDTTQVDRTNINQFFEDNKIVKGKKRQDLDKVKKLLEPSEKLTIAEESALKNYESQVESIKNSKLSSSAKEQAIAQLEKPKGNNPTVADLDEARQNINDMIGDLERSGQNNRARQLKEAKKALDKDLEPFPLQKEVTAKYAELSKPVNEILEHPKLKKIPKSRANDIFDGLFTNTETSGSKDNFKSLKQVLKDRPEEWKGVQDATVDYLMRSIRNSKAQGRRNVLSYDKLNKFLKKHQGALDEVFTADQMKFLDELKSSLKGINQVEGLGLEGQSATYGKLITGAQLREGFGSKLLKGSTYLPHATSVPMVGKATGEVLRTLLNGYFKTREADVMAVLDNFLKNPEYAPKLLNHKFKTQAEFNKQMANFQNQTISTITNIKEKDNGY